MKLKKINNYVSCKTLNPLLYRRFVVPIFLILTITCSRLTSTQSVTNSVSGVSQPISLSLPPISVVPTKTLTTLLSTIPYQDDIITTHPKESRRKRSWHREQEVSEPQDYSSEETHNTQSEYLEGRRQPKPTYVLHSEAGEIPVDVGSDESSDPSTGIIPSDDYFSPSSSSSSTLNGELERGTNIGSSSNSRNSLSNAQVGSDFYKETYVATTPKLIDSDSSLSRSMHNTDSSGYQSIYDDDYDNSNDVSGELSSTTSSTVSFFESAKSMWDIFNALNTAWKKIGEKQAVLKDTQHDVRNSTDNDDKMFDEQRSRRESEDNTENTNSETDSATQLAVQEGRYIKGDPLSGYYDFVITEGSYKFWAAFQLATAILVIYSTFAAIYYSKVNPLVGDYDYTDYLGGGRSFSGDALDFEDDDTSTSNSPYKGSAPENSSSYVDNDRNSTTQKDKSPISKSSSLWTSLVQGEWLPNAGHAFEFILEAIDKIPQ